jgi:hypothetical protein
MSFLFNAGVFKKSTRIDPRARLKGRVTDNEFRSFVDSCLKANKSPGPDGYTNECVKTMSHAELEVLRAWANEILALEEARVMTVGGSAQLHQSTGNAHSQRAAQKHCGESRYPEAGPIRGEAG